MLFYFKGILQGVYWGLGTGGGTIVGGYVTHVFGFRSTFRGFAVVTGVVLAVFLTTQLISKYSDLPEQSENEEVIDDEEFDHEEMFLGPRAKEKEHHHSDDNDVEEAWEEQWKTPLNDEPVESHSQPRSPQHAESPQPAEAPVPEEHSGQPRIQRTP